MKRKGNESEGWKQKKPAFTPCCLVIEWHPLFRCFYVLFVLHRTLSDLAPLKRTSDR